MQGLDGELHRTRKQMFLAIVAQNRLDSLLREVTARWGAALVKWSALPHVELYPEVQLLLARAVCAWAGVPLPEADVQARTTDLVLLFDAAGAVGPRHFASRRARRRLEEWLSRVVQASAMPSRPAASTRISVRSVTRRVDGPPGSAASR